MLPASSPKISRLPFLVLAGVLAVYLILVVMHGRFLNVDEVFYKAAGAHWALDNHFAAPELFGRLPFDPPIEKVFACYPPLYPFAFGVFTHAWGFGHLQICVFDALLRVLLCAVTAYTARRLTPGGCSSWPAAMAGLLVLPLSAIGRPDDLAVIWGLLACTRLMPSSTHARCFQAGILLGLSAATSIVAAGVLAAVATGLVVAEPGAPGRSRLSRVMIMGGVSAAVLIAAFVPLLCVDGNAWRQIIDHGADNVRSDTFWTTWQEAWRNGRYTMTASGGLVLAAFILLFGSIRTSLFGDIWLRWFPAVLLVIALIVLKTAGKFYYIWFAGPWLVAACMALFAQAWTENVRRGVALTAAGILVGGCIYGAQFWVVERLALACLPPDQRFEAASERIKAVVPAGATVMAFEHWITLVGRNPIREHNTPSPENTWASIDYIVLTGNGSGAPGVAQLHLPAFIDYAAAHFEKIDDNLSVEPLRLGGIRITNSAYGWGAVIYRRVGR
ncbi:MAG: hypothetical protein ACAH89_14795 [Rariglobus sp.]